MQGLGLDEEPFPSFPDSRPPKTAPRPRITAHSVTWNRRSQQIQGIMARGGIRRGQAIAPEGFGLTPEALTRPMTSASLFGNDAPLELEVGSGNGTLLVTESKARAGVNFLGIEYTRRYWRYAADRLRRNDCENARVVLADAATLISRLHLRRHELDVVRTRGPSVARAAKHGQLRPDRVKLESEGSSSGRLLCSNSVTLLYVCTATLIWALVAMTDDASLMVRVWGRGAIIGYGRAITDYLSSLTISFSDSSQLIRAAASLIQILPTTIVLSQLGSCNTPPIGQEIQLGKTFMDELDPLLRIDNLHVELQARATFLLEATVLHELVHYGRRRFRVGVARGRQRGREELIARQFERDAYGRFVTVGSLELAQFMPKTGREKKSRFARELGMVGPHLCQLCGGVSVWCEFTWYRIRVSLLLSD